MIVAAEGPPGVGSLQGRAGANTTTCQTKAPTMMRPTTTLRRLPARIPTSAPLPDLSASPAGRRAMSSPITAPEKVPAMSPGQTEKHQADHRSGERPPYAQDRRARPPRSEQGRDAVKNEGSSGDRPPEDHRPRPVVLPRSQQAIDEVSTVDQKNSGEHRKDRAGKAHQHDDKGCNESSALTASPLLPPPPVLPR